ncbi:MAG: integrase [Paracoccaceae bacterium]|jgi:integrase
MALSINRLTATAVKNQKKPGRYSDGNGLYLQVSRGGSKQWIFRYTRLGTARQMGLGGLGIVTLAEARQDAIQQHQLIRLGKDPIVERQKLLSAEHAAGANSKTFKECATAYIATNEDSWSNTKHRQQWENTLMRYAYPVIGDMPVEAVATSHMLEIIQPLWKTKTETASRLRGRIEKVLDWARVVGYREGENPARWRGHLSETLPKRSSVQKVKHHPAVPYEQVGEFMQDLRQREALSARALEFLILTCARTVEVINAQWDEIDIERKIWVIAAERMKARKEHRAALSDEAITLLEALPRIDGSPFIFAGNRIGRPISNMAMAKLMERMGQGAYTPHGFRSTFRDWSAEQTAFPNEVCEMALAHAVGDKTEAAYRRGDLLQKRFRLAKAWAQYCGTASAGRGNIEPIRKALA